MSDVLFAVKVLVGIFAVIGSALIVIIGYLEYKQSKRIKELIIELGCLEGQKKC